MLAPELGGVFYEPLYSDGASGGLIAEVKRSPSLFEVRSGVKSLKHSMGLDGYVFGVVLGLVIVNQSVVWH